MRTAYLSHPLFLQHEMGGGHPESPARLLAIEQQLKAEQLHSRLIHYTAPTAERRALLRVHHADYLQWLDKMLPQQGHRQLDPDTSINPYSLGAAYHAAGAGLLAVDLVMRAEVDNAFCAVRPPGHHAEPGRAMGFCLFNNIAVAAAHALESYALQRLAIIDFDVHHGNGTEAMFAGDERILLCSSFQHPFYPGTRLEGTAENVLLAPLQAGDGGAQFRAVYEEKILPAVESFAPQLILVSAGFDAHREDTMSGLLLEDEDYCWLSEKIVALASRQCGGRLVSLLEGGYALEALGRSTALHIMQLLALDH